MKLKYFVDKLKEGFAQIFGEHPNATNLPNSFPVDDYVEGSELDIFLQIVYETYVELGGHNYVSIMLLKQKLSKKYSMDQFDELLLQTREAYPSRIWIDKDSRGQTIVKIV